MQLRAGKALNSKPLHHRRCLLKGTSVLQVPRGVCCTQVLRPVRLPLIRVVL